MDNLAYTYTSGKNQLATISDAITSNNYVDNEIPAGIYNFTYNDIGQMISDGSEGYSITYNSMGLVANIKNTNNNNTLVSYAYDQAGNRLRKRSFNNSGVPVTNTYYVRDAAGTVMSIYEQDIITSTTTQTELPVYGMGTIGIIKTGISSGNRTKLKDLYSLSDHLGNIRLVLEDRLNAFGQPVVAQYADYYPFGSLMPGRSLNPSNYRYSYQNQEKDNETGYHNFELRQYASLLGRWMTPDPYGQHYSPYLAMSNNPVSFIDPDGGWDGSPVSSNIDDPNFGKYQGGGLDARHSNWNDYNSFVNENKSELRHFLRNAKSHHNLLKHTYKFDPYDWKKTDIHNFTTDEITVPKEVEDDFSDLEILGYLKSTAIIRSFSEYYDLDLLRGQLNGGGVYSGNNIFAETYWHYQFGHGKPLNVSASSLDLSRISMRTAEIQNIVKQGSGYINLFSYMKNQTGLAIGSVKLNYKGNNTFSLSNDIYDFDIRWEDGSTSRNWATFAAGLIHGPVIDNIPIPIGGPLLFGPSVFSGGKYTINFHGNVTLKP